MLLFVCLFKFWPGSPASQSRTVVSDWRLWVHSGGNQTLLPPRCTQVWYRTQNVFWRFKGLFVYWCYGLVSIGQGRFACASEASLGDHYNCTLKSPLQITCRLSRKNVLATSIGIESFSWIALATPFDIEFFVSNCWLLTHSCKTLFWSISWLNSHTPYVQFTHTCMHILDCLHGLGLVPAAATEFWP